MLRIKVLFINCHVSQAERTLPTILNVTYIIVHCLFASFSMNVYQYTDWEGVMHVLWGWPQIDRRRLDALGSYRSMDTAVKLRLGDSCHVCLCYLVKIAKGLETRDHTWRDHITVGVWLKLGYSWLSGKNWSASVRVIPTKPTALNSR